MHKFWTGLAVFAALGTAAAAPAVARDKDELVIGISQFPPDMHPYIQATVAKSYVSGPLRRWITAYDKDWKLVCMLCTEVPTFENGRAKMVDLDGGKKGVAVTFTIRPDMNWGDGKPVSAKDVVFGWEVSKQLRPFPSMVKVEATDEKTFVITHNAVRYDYAWTSDLLPLPEHIEGAIFKAAPNGAEYGKQSTYNRDPQNAGLWYGPYKIKDFKSNDYISYEPNPQWKGKAPFFKKLTIRTIENTAALEANLLSGDIDYISGELGLTTDQGLSLSKRAADKFGFSFVPATTLEQFYINMEDPILKDKRVRQALAYAIDRTALVNKLFEGKTLIGTSYVNPREDANNPDIKKYTQDIKKAKALLEEAGFKPGPDGIGVNAQGQRLSFEFTTTAGNRTRELIQQVLQSQAKDAGFELAIKNVPARTLFGELYPKRTFQVGMSAWSSSPNNPQEESFHSRFIPTADNSYSGNNTSGFRNAEFDKLMEAAIGEVDAAKRKQLMLRMQDIYVDELPRIPIYWYANPFIIPKNLKGVEATGHSYVTTNWVENWSRD